MNQHFFNNYVGTTFLLANTNCFSYDRVMLSGKAREHRLCFNPSHTYYVPVMEAHIKLSATMRCCGLLSICRVPLSIFIFLSRRNCEQELINTVVALYRYFSLPRIQGRASVQTAKMHGEDVELVQ